MSSKSVMAAILNPPAMTPLADILGSEVTPSMESDGAAQGQTVKEREYEIYGKVDDLAAMKAGASRYEYQEQWGMPADFGKDAGIFGSIRVRMTRENDDGESKYTQTIKEKQPDGSDENEIEIGESTFSIFSRLVPNGLLKTRYFFPLAGTEFELQVDVFNQPDGKQCNVVKIDLEVPEGVTVGEIKIPFKIEVTKVIRPGKKSSDDSSYVRDLFQNHYEFKNPLHVKKPAGEPETPAEGESASQDEQVPA
ncbi:hypothetical protein D3C76_37200 [compost metagenome]